MLRFSIVLLLAAVCACGVAEPSIDAGRAEPRPDAGEAIDAASEPVDAGPDADVGIELPDAGSTMEDAGDPLDAGSELDAGAEPPDAGPIDAGPPPDEPIAIVGYGAATRGGWQPGHDVVFVTSLADDGDGSLRAALRTNDAPRLVRFALDGTIALQAPLLLPSNVTVDGRGRAITLAGKGLIVPGTDDVIVTHLTIENVLPKSEDALRIGDPANPTERVAVDHVTIRHTDGKGGAKFTDEAVSVVWGATDVTLAWLRIENQEKVFLFGNGDAPASLDGNMRITVHHTYTKNTGRRHPQARHGTFDFFDNWFHGWTMYSGACAEPYPDAFGMLAESSARIRAEANAFSRPGRSAYDTSGIPLLCPTRVHDATGCNSGGQILELGNEIAPDNADASLRFGVGCPRNASVPRPYAAVVEPAGEALRARLVAEAGNVP